MRYTRHHSLYNFGKTKQELLSTKKALIIGCGGLGCSAALNLVGSGIHTLGLMDKDTVCISNLHRQHGHCSERIGNLKVQSLKESCNKLNPDVLIITYTQWFDTTKETKEIVKKYDIVLDCSDNATTRININRMCKSLEVPLVFASSIGWDGQVCFIDPNGPCLECVFPGMKQTSDTCESRGVFGPVPGIMGSMQAIEAIKYLIGLENSNKLLMYDSLHSCVHEIQLESNRDCLVCGNNNFITTVYSVKEYSEYLSDSSNKILIDIRTGNTEHEEIRDSVHVNQQDITQEWVVSMMSKNIYVLCEYGERSNMVVSKIRGFNYANAWSIHGGSRAVFS
jgi:molybdopterin/thiamine biosynthesis adenylyltransferase/rhodanese-related sulfurtransferase